MHEILIISSDAARTIRHLNTTVVATPLDAIVWLDQRHSRSTVVLSGSYALNDDLAVFLAEVYPAVELQREA